MSFEFRLAYKYFRARRRSLARFTSVAAIAGICCGVAGLIAAQALTTGFRRELREKILDNQAHITIFRADGAEIENWQTLENDLEKIENISKVSPTVYQSALLINNANAYYAVLRTTNDAEKTASDSLAPIEIELGAALAEKSHLQAGDEAEIIVPTEADGLSPKKFRARVAQVFRTGIYDYDAVWIRLAPESLARVLESQTFTPTVLNVAVSEPDAAPETARKIREKLSADFKVLDWREANQPLLVALDLEKKVALAIIALITIIAALNITTTLALLVQERKLDIAVLRTCGASGANLVTMFLLEGIFLGATGTLLGVILGLTLCFVFNYFNLISLPPDVYAVSSVKLVPNFADVVLTILVALILSLAGTAYPAWRASKIKPLENLRRV